MTDHQDFMKEALNMAEIALKNNEIPVGCVFVHKNKMIAKEMNNTNKSFNGIFHCEIIAINNILKDYPSTIFEETDLYVTVEPCIMCASALRQLHIRSVYFGCANERFGGTGSVLRLHDDKGVDPTYPVFPGNYRKEAIFLLRQFYLQENKRAPKPKSKKNRVMKYDLPYLDLSRYESRIHIILSEKLILLVPQG
ncbi:uncharacterized protein T551_01111 [Pneumocystis jirovecii RU7]|uniref:tRNA(adenine(34)) deaminase n=2 Tax=Pneumocystis jirovecii TaxID=42068 RepID=A0A0W4ZU00_PNEJ7|nr:uncharacterized protein T551_01111 [Pneumocystis jirovecii RU7]KTW31850.1 hypothetical protein T551_01111 [Pneumocystis jirovecii RU7]